MVNVLFCILRNSDSHIETMAASENVNTVLHEYQKQFAGNAEKGRKAFVYQAGGRVIIQEFGKLSADDIFLMDACRENGHYSYCLSAAFAVMNDFTAENPCDENYLVILMQEPIKYQDTIFFLKYLIPQPVRICHHVILIQSSDTADDRLCAFIGNDGNYSKKNFFIHKIMTFNELYNDRSGYDLCSKSSAVRRS